MSLTPARRRWPAVSRAAGVFAGVGSGVNARERGAGTAVALPRLAPLVHSGARDCDCDGWVQPPQTERGVEQADQDPVAR
jgi:hypothetical protein